MVTLADVARVAGVSKTTVSHVINATRFVSADAVQRVEEAILSTGFRPNPYARALRTATTQTLGFVSSDISNPFSTAVMQGIEFATSRAHHTLLVANSRDDPQLEEQAIDALEQRRIDGLIIAMSPNSSETVLHRIKDFSVPVVLVDRDAPLPVDRVIVENVEAVAELIDLLLEQGHTRIGVIAGEERHNTSAERVRGWRLAHERRGLTVDAADIHFVGPTAHDAQEATLDVLRSAAPRPTALFTTNSTMTQGTLRGLREAGLSLPRDMSMVAFDDFEWADLLSPPLTCLAQPTFDIGVNAVQLLLDRIGDATLESRTVRLDPELRLRSSSIELPVG
jgi:LacI family transcriptional regulator